MYVPEYHKNAEDGVKGKIDRVIAPLSDNLMKRTKFENYVNETFK